MLVELDTRQEHAQLAAIEAQRDLASLNYQRMKGLLSDRVISQAEFDRAVAEQKQTDAEVGEIRATIARKTIRAPFSGVLGIRQVNLGQYLAAGDPIVPVQSLDPIYVNFGVPQQDAGRIRVGHAVRLTARDLPEVDFDGRVTAVDSTVDQSTRNVQVQATLANQGASCAPACLCRPSSSGIEPRGADVASIGHQLCAVRRFGVCRHRPEGRERTEPRRAAAIREARRRARRGWRS